MCDRNLIFIQAGCRIYMYFTNLQDHTSNHNDYNAVLHIYNIYRNVQLFDVPNVKPVTIQQIDNT